MKIIPLSNDQIAFHKANLLVIVGHADLTESAANTAQTIPLLSLAAGKAARFVKYDLVTPFKDASDAAFNTTAAIIGDGNDTDRFLASTELNVNGTEVLRKFGQPAAGVSALTAATVSTVDATTEATVYALANALKVEINKVITDIGAIRTALLGSPFFVYTSADTLDLIVASMAEKALADIDTGEVHFYFEVQ